MSENVRNDCPFGLMTTDQVRESIIKYAVLFYGKMAATSINITTAALR